MIKKYMYYVAAILTHGATISAASMKLSTLFVANCTTSGLSSLCVINSLSLAFEDCTNESAIIIGVKHISHP